jgi:hypothetical protein
MRRSPRTSMAGRDDSAHVHVPVKGAALPPPTRNGSFDSVSHLWLTVMSSLSGVFPTAAEMK